MLVSFPQDCSSSVTFPIAWIKGSVAFSRGFPTGLFYVPQWCESILGVKVEALQGKQVPLEWAETSEGLLEWWHDAGVPLAFPVERASSLDGMGMLRILSRPSREGSLIWSYEAETGLLWIWAGPSCFL